MGRTLGLDKACEVQIAATAAGAGLVMPGRDICELTARQLAGEDDTSDLQDDMGYELAWSAMLRLVECVAPDYKD
ncbi:hypothetical protein ACIBCS_01305 [Streptomyces phaeochromogenes]|uniref:hypothetical protein n=1 Tax=Streptomyces phaeochromogenes TaxID=1923 RepID=UPI0033FBE42B